jgi:hypothetical protein
MIAAARRFHGSFLSGWWRWRREHFTVFAGPVGGPLAPIRAPFGSYFADPFPLVHDGVPWLLLEQFRYSHNRGRLVARRLAGGPLVPLRLAGSGHASFPCVFVHEGQLCLLPETGGDGTLDLYVCRRFPHEWQLVRRLATELDAADTVPLFHAGRWWLITSLRHRRADGGHRHLAIFHTADLVRGELTPHPINAERRFADSPFSFGRNAGPIFAPADAPWLRPIHASRRYYGEQLAWRRIDALSPDAFAESSCPPPPALRAALPDRPLHHLALAGDVLACDTRDRFPTPDPTHAA